MKRIATAFACASLLAGCGGDEPESAAPQPTAQAQLLAGAPPPLARLHEQANQLLDGGPSAFRKRLEELEGFPVVVNKWASWCPPCRAEFPYFQKQSLARGKKVAFLGVDSNDNDEDAREFLEDFPVSYPSYKDPRLDVARVFKGGIAFPTTAFYDSDGELAFVKQGGYSSEQDLIDDLDRYAK